MGQQQFDLGLRIAAMYKIICEYGLTYIGETGCKVADRCKNNNNTFNRDVGLHWSVSWKPAMSQIDI